MSMHLVLREMMALLVTFTAVESSHLMEVFGFGYPILMSAWRSGTIFLAMVKRPASSALKVDDMTLLMICAIVRTGPLWRVNSTSSERMMWASARLRACDMLR